MNLTNETEEEDDGRWIADVTALPGVLAYGATREEAVSRVQALALRVLADRGAGLDDEQLQLSASDEFWRLIAERRQRKTISRDELDDLLSDG